MGLFDKMFKVNEQRVSGLKINSDEAFLGIIISSVLVDEQINRQEMNNLSFFLSRFKGLGNMNPMQFQQLMDRFQNIIKREGVGTIIAAAKSSLDKDLKETAFANAVEIVLADGFLDVKEKEFLENLQRSLGIPDELAEKILEVIILKNKGTTADIFQKDSPDRMFM